MKVHKFDSIVAALRHPGMVFTAITFLVAFGLWSLPVMNKDEFPQFTMRYGVIAAIYPGATAEEVEQQVTKPLERFLYSYSEIERAQTYSITNDGIVYIYASLRLAVSDPDEVWSKIRAGLALFRTTTLPAGVAEIVVVDDFGSTSSVLLALESPSHSPRELERYATSLCDELRTIADMGKISVLGKEREEIAVTIDPAKLASLPINQSALMAQLALQGFRTIGGTVDNEEGSTLLHVAIPYATEYEVGEQVIFSNPIDNKVVKLRDIATITRRYQAPDKYVVFYRDSIASSSIIINMEMYPNRNIVRFGKEVDNVLTRAQASLPPDLRFHRITDQPHVVDDSVSNFLRDLVLSMLVVILVMLLLFPLRTALIAATAVPTCATISLGIMYIAGIELNTVTLAAMITVIGMVVDDAVIVLDGYTLFHDKGYSRWYSASVSTRQLMGSMLLATASIAGMFFPMTRIITGPLGEFVQDFPWAILFALAISNAYAVWAIPWMATKLIKGRGMEQLTLIERAQKRFFAHLEAGYQKLLTFCFGAPYLTLAIALLLVLLGGFIFTHLNIQMLPKADREVFAVEIHLSEGASLSQTAVVADSLARVLNQDPRVISVTSFVGQASPRFHATYNPCVSAKNYAQFIVNTISPEATLEVLDEYGERYANAFPNAYCRFKQMDYQAVKNPIEVYIKGQDRVQMEVYKDSLIAFMHTLPDLQWVHSDYDLVAPDVRIDLHADDATRLGITQASLSLYLASVYSSQTITSIWEEDYEVPVRLYLSSGDESIASVGDCLIPTAIPGQWVPLRQIATLTPQWHHTTLDNRNGITTITVSADLVPGASAPPSEKVLHEYIDHLRSASLTPVVPDISMGGLANINTAIIPQLVWSVIAALLVMLILLLIHYGNAAIALLALSMSVLCLFGCCLGLYIFRLDFSITALLGVVAVLGIVVRNAILMYDYALELQHKGLSTRDAAYQAGLRRMRPIFLTSATTALGVIPMIIAHTGLWMPLGVTICFGTIFTLPLNVTVMPIAYWKLISKKSERPSGPLPFLLLPIALVSLLPCTVSAQEALSLDSCYALALKNSAQTTMAHYEVEQAKQVRNQARTKYFPQISAGAFGYHALRPLMEVDVMDVLNANADQRALFDALYNQFGEQLGLTRTYTALRHGFIVSANAVQPVFMGGQIVNGNKLAKVGVEAAQLKEELSAREVLNDVETGYWLVIQLQEKQKTLEHVTALLDTLAENVSTAISAGLAVPNDLLRVQLKQNETLQQQIQLHSGLALAKEALCLTLGLDSLPPLISPFDTADSSDALENMDTLGRTEQPRNLETQLLALQLRATTLEKQIAIGQTLPAVAIGVNYNYNNLLYDRWKHNGLAYFTVSVPLSRWWETAHKIKEYDYKIAAYQKNLVDVTAKLTMRQQQVYDQVEADRQGVAIAQLTRLQAAENLRVCRLNYEAGLCPIADLLEAETLLLKADNEYIDALVALHIHSDYLNRL